MPLPSLPRSPHCSGVGSLEPVGPPKSIRKAVVLIIKPAHRYYSNPFQMENRLNSAQILNPTVTYTHGLIMQCHGRFMFKIIQTYCHHKMVFNLDEHSTTNTYPLYGQDILKPQYTIIHEAGTYPRWKFNH